jgi:hypothetical protein
LLQVGNPKGKISDVMFASRKFGIDLRHEIKIAAPLSPQLMDVKQTVSNLGQSSAERKIYSEGMPALARTRLLRITTNHC